MRRRARVVEPKSRIEGQLQLLTLEATAQGQGSTRPTPDQRYLMERVNTDWSGLRRGALSFAAIQKLNSNHGVSRVSDALRQLHGFPPEEAIRSPYAYLVSMLEAESA